jgi:hypothetical protein
MNYEWYESDDESEDIANGLAAILSPRGLNASPGSIERQVENLFGRLSPADSENFMNALKDVGKGIQKVTSSKEFKGIVSTAAPIAGGALGTFIGGPLGTQIGSQLGSVAGQALTGGGIKAFQPKGGVKGLAQAAAVGALQGGAGGALQGAAGAIPALGGVLPALGIAPPQDPAAGSTAAAQLLSVVQNPALLSSLLSLTMGANGAQTVPVGGTNVPVGAMMNLVGTLANRAAEDADAILAADQETAPEYLLDASGCLTCDPAVPSHRADAVMRLLYGEAEAEYEADAEAEYEAEMEAEYEAEEESEDYDYLETEYDADWAESEWMESDW